MKKIPQILGMATLLGLASSPSADAHGINGHLWVTDGGLDSMRNCEVAGWLSNETFRPILQIGASFPDSGYALEQGRPYGETAHWEPFVQAYIEYMRKNYGPPYDSEEARKRVAFLLGFAAHGAEDEVFDTIFLRKSIQEEGNDQDILDPGTDFMLIAEGHTRLRPDIYLPVKDLEKIFRDPKIDLDVTEDMMNAGMLVVRLAVISLATDESEQLDDRYRPLMPWTKYHYLDPRQPGSFPFEKRVMGPYYDAIWKRLNGEFRPEDMLIYASPATEYGSVVTDHNNVDSYVNLIFGIGVWNRSLTADTVKLLDAKGHEVAVDIRYTRWGNVNDTGRLVQLRPLADLKANQEYTAVLLPGIELIDHSFLKSKITYQFRTACAPGTCEPVDPPTTPAPVCSLYAKPVSAPAGPVTPRSGCASGGDGELGWVLLGAGLLLTANHLRRLLKTA